MQNSCHRPWSYLRCQCWVFMQLLISYGMWCPQWRVSQHGMTLAWICWSIYRLWNHCHWDVTWRGVLLWMLWGRICKYIADFLHNWQYDCWHLGANMLTKDQIKSWICPVLTEVCLTRGRVSQHDTHCSLLTANEMNATTTKVKLFIVYTDYIYSKSKKVYYLKPHIDLQHSAAEVLYRQSAESFHNNLIAIYQKKQSTGQIFTNLLSSKS